jgi:tetratricopeptide (TPR) repeat protein
LFFLAFLGCQGCQSQSEGEDFGGPGALRKKEETVPPGKREEVSPRESSLDPKEQALIEKMAFIEDRLAELGRMVSTFSGERKEVRRKKALEAFREVLERNPQDPRRMMVMARGLLMAGEFEEARKMYGAALAADPEMFPVWKGIALAWIMDTKDEKKAAEALENLQSPDAPGPFGRILIGEFWMETGKEDRAEKVLLEAHKAFPRSIHPLLRLMQVYLSKGALEQGFDAASKALERDRENQKAWTIKALLHVAFCKDYEEKKFPRGPKPYEEHKVLAKLALEEVIRLGPETPRGRDAALLLERLKDPLKIYKDAALDSTAPERARKKAFRILFQRAREAGLPFWKKAVNLPEKNMRLLAIQGVASYGGKEGLELLAELIRDGKRSSSERSQAVEGMNEIHKGEREIFEEKEITLLTVESLIEGLRICKGNLHKDKYEKSAFQGILKSLNRFTRKHFGEGADHGTPEGMDAIITEWSDWWEREKEN